MGSSDLWNVLRVGRFKSRSLVMGRFENGMFQEQDLLYVHWGNQLIISNIYSALHTFDQKINDDIPFQK